MAKVFNFIRRSAELAEEGLSVEEAMAVMEGEEAEADATVLDDGAWWDDIRDGVEAAVEADLAIENGPHD